MLLASAHPCCCVPWPWADRCWSRLCWSDPCNPLIWISGSGPLQWLLDEISLARAIGDRRGACVAALGAHDRLLDLLPELQRRRPGLDHWALHDRILSVLPLCR